MQFVLQVVIGVIGCTIACVIAGSLLYQRRMSKHRGVSRGEFVGAFSGTDIPPRIPAAVYDYYAGSVVSKNLRVAPEDSYEDLLKGEEEIDEDVQFLLRKLRLEPPPQDVASDWMSEVRALRRPFSAAPVFATSSNQWTQPILTVREMVLWLDWVRRHQPS